MPFLTCWNCGAKMQQYPGARFTICQHCKSQNFPQSPTPMTAAQTPSPSFPAVPMKKPFFKRKVVLLGIVLLVIMIAVVASAANNPSTISGTSKSPGTSQNKAMKISYTVVNLGDASQWDPSIAPGSAFLVVNMTIHNQGYDTFSVNPLYFKAVVDNVAYSYSTYSYKLGDEGYTRLGVASVLDGGTFTGALAFEVPQGYSQVSMQYQGLRTYSIDWIRA